MKIDEKALLDNLTGEDALRVLQVLCASDPVVRKRVIDETKRTLMEVDVDEVAESVFQALDMICVEDLWDRSGPSSHGYSSPDDMAAEMFEEAIQPHRQEIEKYRRLGLTVPRMCYLMGALKGIYRFEKEAKSEFKDWATDLPAESFGFLLDEWRKDSGQENRKKMNAFITKQCPDWSAWATKNRS